MSVGHHPTVSVRHHPTVSVGHRPHRVGRSPTHCVCSLLQIIQLSDKLGPALQVGESLVWKEPKVEQAATPAHTDPAPPAHPVPTDQAPSGHLAPSGHQAQTDPALPATALPATAPLGQPSPLSPAPLGQPSPLSPALSRPPARHALPPLGSAGDTPHKYDPRGSPSSLRPVRGSPPPAYEAGEGRGEAGAEGRGEEGAQPANPNSSEMKAAQDQQL